VAILPGALFTKNMVLVVSGAVDTARMKKFLNYFVDKQAPHKARALSFIKKDFRRFAWPAHKPSLEHRVRVTEKKIDQAHVMLGFPGLLIIIR